MTDNASQMMQDFLGDWGPWIEHDGKGCPDLVGHSIECVVRRDEDAPKVRVEDCEEHYSAPWLWAILPCHYQIIRYRVRKPRGLTILEELIADLPAPAPNVDANAICASGGAA
jgi:hypothetical protein